MFCPNCGAEVRPEEKYCQSCGAVISQQAGTQAVEYQAPAYQPDAYQAPVYQTPAPAEKLSYKDFIKSSFCTPDVNKNIKASWILMLICGALSAAVQIVGGSFPIDGILMGGLAIWLMLSKSFPAGLVSCIVGILELVLTTIYMGQVAGWLPAIAGIYALIATLKGKKQYKAYLES